MTPQEVAVLDYGSQYSQLIVRRVRELGFASHLYPPAELANLQSPGAIILSGGPRSTTEKDAPDVDYEKLMSFGVPVLGVCYGMQLLNIKHGGTVKPGVTREYGPAKLVVTDHEDLFAGISHESQVWMSHSDTCANLANTTKVIATNEDAVPVALKWSDRCWGIQFHPEVTRLTMHRWGVIGAHRFVLPNTAIPEYITNCCQAIIDHWISLGGDPERYQ